MFKLQELLIEAGKNKDIDDIDKGLHPSLLKDV